MMKLFGVAGGFGFSVGSTLAATGGPEILIAVAFGVCGGTWGLLLGAISDDVL